MHAYIYACIHTQHTHRLGLILFSTLFFHCINYEAVDSAPFNCVEYCQAKRDVMYVENIVKMYRIQMQIHILF